MQFDKARCTWDLLQHREKMWRRPNELPLAQIEPAPGRSHRRRAFTSRRPDLVLDDESRSVGTHGERRTRDGHCLVEADFPEVLELVLANDRAEREPTELAGRKAMFGEERHANVSREVEVRPVRHVAIEIHGAPARKELSGVAIGSGCRHGSHSRQVDQPNTRESTYLRVNGAGRAKRAALIVTLGWMSVSSNVF